MAYRIQVRRDTAINWTNTNPILASGEMGLETDTRKFKFGDGATAWNLLAYAVDAISVSSVNSKNGDVVLTTDDIGVVPDRQYVTDTDLVNLSNLSGTNTGDQDLSGLLPKNVPITGATKTKVTYDANGLVTSGADATTADIAASTDKNYVTDAQLTVIGNTSGTNTGDQDLSNLKRIVPQEIIVAKSGGEFTSVKSAMDSILDASATKQYIVKVKPGTYNEAPFTMKQFVSLVGEGGYYNVNIKTTDNNSHFITSIDKSEIVNCALEGPTGVGYATVNHTTASYSPFKLINVAIRAGYYGIWCHPAASKGIVHCFNVVNWYSGSATNRLFYASDYGNFTGMSSGWMAGPPGKCSYGFVCDGANADMTLDLCFFRNGGSGGVLPIAVFADNGSVVRLTAFTASEADTAIKIGTVGATSVHAVSCVLKDEVTNHIDIGSATAVLEFSGAADNTKITVANGAKFSAMFSDTATPGQEGTRVLGELWLGTTNAAVPLRDYGLKTYYSGWISGGVCTKSATALRVDVTAGTGFINTGTNVHSVSWDSGYIDIVDNTAGQYIYVTEYGVIQTSLTSIDAASYILLAIGDAYGGDITFLADHRIPISHYISAMTSYLEDVVGPISISGAVTSVHGSTTQLDVTGGLYKLYHTPITITGAAPISIHTLYRDGSGGWIHTIGVTSVDTAKYDDGSGTLADLPSGKYKKDLLFATKIGDTTYYHLIYGQEVFDSKSLAETGNNPIVPNSHTKYALRLAGIVSLSGATTVASIVDQRPKLGQMAGSVASISDHGELTGLLDDDHPAYFNQARGDARYALASQVVTNGNNHDHVGGDGAQIAYSGLSGIPSTFTPSAHAATHVTGGGDTIANASGSAAGLMSSADKTKLDSVASGAEANVNADWNAVSGDAQILNKPTTMTPSSHDNTAHSTAYATASDVSTHTGDSTIHFTQAAIDHTNITNKGTNTHAQIDTFIGTKAAASGLASLNASTKVVQDPANATGTTTAFKIPIADGSGKLDSWITTFSQRGQATTSANITPLALSSAGSGSLDAKDDHTHRGPGGIASRTSTIAVANVETVILTATLPANFMQAGTTFRVRATGVGTSGTTAGTSIWRVRIGTSTLGNIAASVSVANAASITNGSFIVEGMIVVRSGGAGGTIIGDLSAYGNENTRIFTNRVNLSSVTSTVGVDCTAANLLEFTLVSGNAGTTFTTHLATFEVVMM